MENIKRWKTRDPIPPEVEEALAGFHPILRQILFNRGLLDFRQADEFLEATRPQDSDPFSMLGMQEAVDRLAFAVNRGERIAVYGDYDADGVSATALMMQTFKALKANVRHYIPNRHRPSGHRAGGRIHRRSRRLDGHQSTAGRFGRALSETGYVLS